MKLTEDFEFEALLESVVEERVAIEPPAGLAQRLMARLVQAAAQQPARSAAASIKAVQFRDFGVLNDGRKSKGALLLSAMEELNSREVGEVMGVAEGTVRTRLMRARTELRAKFYGTRFEEQKIRAGLAAGREVAAGERNRG